ncbi:MAG: hypothetical protein MZV70_21470 [Desulfobacterales bacterium]|nr:hypothetical protein [Desulfobacterales bacterium]
MRDINECNAHFALAFNLQLHFLAQFQVESAEGLIEEKNFGFVDQRLGKRDALLLSAGELFGAAHFHAGQSHHLEGLPETRLERSAFPTPFISKPKPIFCSTVMMEEWHTAETQCSPGCK